MSSNLDQMQELDDNLNKSLDDIMRANKSGRGRGGGRNRGRGRDRGGMNRGRGMGRGMGRGGRGGRGNRLMRNNNTGRLINRNRYSARQRFGPIGRNNNNARNNGFMRNNDNFNSNRPMGRGGNRGNMRRLGGIPSRNMKRQFPNFGNTPVPQRLGPKRGAPQRKIPRLSPLRRNISTSGAVIVQGLLPHVTSDDIKEIFETIGVVTKAYVKYSGQTGKSTGVAQIVYAHRNDARRAQRELNGRLIDQAPITVRLVFNSPLLRPKSFSSIKKWI